MTDNTSFLTGGTLTTEIGTGAFTINGSLSSDCHFDQSASLALGFDLDANSTYDLGLSAGLKDVTIYDSTTVTDSSGITTTTTHEIGVPTWLLAAAYISPIAIPALYWLFSSGQTPQPAY